MTDTETGAAEAVAEDTTLDSQVADDTSENEDQPGEDAAAATDESEDAPAPKPKKSAQERINELTAKQREAERRAQAAEARLAELQSPASQPQTDGKPDPEQYPGGVYDPDYIDALTDWKVEQAVEKRTKETAQRQTLQTKVKTFEERVSQTFPDGEPDGLAAFRELPTLPPALNEILLESEVGPQLADYYGSKPNELARLSAMPLSLQAREIAKVEMGLSAPKTKTATSAPEPAPTLRGQNGQFKVAPDTPNFADFEKQYG